MSASDSGGSGVAETLFAWDSTSCTATNLPGCKVAPDGPPVTVGLEGRHTLTYFSVDKAGNVEPAHHDAINIDQIAPARPTILINGAAPLTSGWYNQSNSPTGVTVAVSSSDATSGVAKLVCTDTVGTTTTTVLDTGGSQTPESGGFNLTDGVHSLRCTATDVAGNASSAATATAQVDLTAPSASPTLSGQLGSNGWYTGPVTVTWHWSDGGSGLSDTCPAISTYSGPDGTNLSLRATCADVAANSTTATSPAFQVDTTRPTIELTTPADGAVYTLNQQVTAVYHCTDATSGIATPNGCAGTVLSGSAIVTDALGSHTFSVTATDNAGNTTTRTISYSVGYGIETSATRHTPIPRGSVAIFRLQVVDGQGDNLSSRSLPVTALDIAPLSQPWDGTNGNFQRAFTYNRGVAPGGGYQLVVNTYSLAPGSYVLSFQVEGDPSIHTLQFSVR